MLAALERSLYQSLTQRSRSSSQGSARTLADKMCAGAQEHEKLGRRGGGDGDKRADGRLIQAAAATSSYNMGARARATTRRFLRSASSSARAHARLSFRVFARERRRRQRRRRRLHTFDSFLAAHNLAATTKRHFEQKAENWRCRETTSHVASAWKKMLFEQTIEYAQASERTSGGRVIVA